jgi:hypothetical protein
MIINRILHPAILTAAHNKSMLILCGICEESEYPAEKGRDCAISGWVVFIDDGMR